MRQNIKVVEYIEIVDMLTNHTLSDAAQQLNALSEKYPASAKIYIKHFGYDGAYQWFIEYTRPETDAEYDARLLTEAKISEKREKSYQALEQKERKEFERLLAKYGAPR